MVTIAKHSINHALLVEGDSGPPKHSGVEFRRACGIGGVQFRPDELAGVILG